MNFHLRKLKQVIATIFALTALTVANANAQKFEISCPDMNITKDVTTQLPRGWWSTPVAGGLTDAAIVNIGDKIVLQCEYGAAGVINYYAPDSAHHCIIRRGTRSSGRLFRQFSCQMPLIVTPVPIPAVFDSGQLQLARTFVMDLDQGTVGGLTRGGDIWFQVDRSNLPYFNPRSGAKMWVGNGSQRGYLGCSAGGFTSERVSLRDIYALPSRSASRVYVCVKTSAGRISEINFTKPANMMRLNINYTTWKLPSE